MTADQRKLNEAQILTFVCAPFIHLLQHVMKAREPLKLKMVCAVHNGFLAAIQKSLRTCKGMIYARKRGMWHLADDCMAYAMPRYCNRLGICE